MKILIRCDSDREMGTGHVRRCLALASELTERQAECAFLGRGLRGSLAKEIRRAGCEIHALPEEPETVSGEWSWQQDRDLCLKAGVELGGVDWLVVDHYSLDSEWETAMRPVSDRILVIDDLADRNHDCDLLLDPMLQSNGESRYQNRIPAGARSCLGPQYAPLRREFHMQRGEAIVRTPPIRRILVFFGGTDPSGATERALPILGRVCEPTTVFDVVMGSTAPGLASVEDHVADIPRAQLSIDVPDMASRMCNAHLAIGAAGSTSWERCAMGLPALLVSVAGNQDEILESLADCGAVIDLKALDLGYEQRLEAALGSLQASPHQLSEMSQAAFGVCDAKGATRIAETMVAMMESVST